jgi:hypothetical protein
LFYFEEGSFNSSLNPQLNSKGSSSSRGDSRGDDNKIKDRDRKHNNNKEKEQGLPPPAVEPPIQTITNLIKIYTDNEKKFEDKLYDVLDVKLQMFTDCCRKISILSDFYYQAFSVMLKSRAATFYYNKISGNEYNYNNIVKTVCKHFETNKNRQLYITK